MKQRKWTDEQLKIAVKESNNYAQVSRKLGLKSIMGDRTTKKYIIDMGLDTSHFHPFFKQINVTDEQFIKIVKESSSLIQIANKLGLKSPNCQSIKKRIKKLNLNITHLNCGSNNSNWKGCENISGSYFASIRCGAKYRNLPFLITIKQIWDIYKEQNGKCNLTGLPIYFSDKTASLDRIDSSKGYIKENVQWVHQDINYMKQDFTEEKFITYCKLIAKKLS